MRHSIRSTEGLLLIDHSASPGLPADFYHKIGLPGGVATGEGSKAELPTMTCCHCNTIVIMRPDRVRPRNHCRKCNQYVCDNPACNAECHPFTERLDKMEKRILREQNHLSGFNFRKDSSNG